MRVIAIDIGATKVSMGIVKNDSVLKEIKFPTKSERGPNYVINKIITQIELLISEDAEKIDGIGIGCPGPLNYKTGVITNSPNLKGWKKVSLKKILERRLKIHVKVDNDANVFVLGEKKASNKVGITLGSGVGSGVVIGGKLYHGNEFASEIGHMIIKADGREGSDGLDGSFENYCGGISIEKKYYEKTGRRKSMQEIAKLEDKESKAVIDEAAHYLAIALNNIKNIFDPELIIIGGSLSKVTYMVKKAIKEMNNMPYKSKVRVEISKNNNSALIGAYRLFTE